MLNIKKIREEKGLTQMELATVLNVSQSTIAMWETNKSLPRVETLKAIAKAFGCTVDELLQSPAESA